jgi:hypothetical protein
MFFFRGVGPNGICSIGFICNSSHPYDKKNLPVLHKEVADYARRYSAAGLLRFLPQAHSSKVAAVSDRYGS